MKINRFIVSSILLGGLFSYPANCQTAIEKKFGVENSVLATGQWYKIRVAKNGVYQISFNDLNEWGIDVASIDPSTIRVFGNGSGMLPQSLSLFRYDDLTENAIFVSGEEDGNFNNTDYILFYGQGADKYEFIDSTGNFTYTKNIYSDSAYYFLNFNLEEGLRITAQDNQGNDFEKINSFDHYDSYESERFNLISSGRKWFGDGFKSGFKEFNFNTAGIISNTPAKLTASTLSFKSYDNNATFEVALGTEVLGTIDHNAVTDYRYGIQGIEKTTEFDFNTSILSNNNQINVRLGFTPSANFESTGYLDYLFLNVQRSLSLHGNQTIFRSLESLNFPQVTFEIGNMTNNNMIWDITNPLLPKQQTFDLNGQTATFGNNISQLKEFIIFNTAYLAVDFSGQVENQDLHGGEVPVMVIITTEDLKAEATRLANFRTQNDNLSVKVVTIQQVYNEFSSGAQDISAIRDYMKHLYDKDPNTFRYLLLFGKCSYDYKNILGFNLNKIPTYESRNSMWVIRSFSSDDYFGFLEDDEGAWEEELTGDHTLEIGIGRIPVHTNQEAATIVDKIIYYQSNPSTLGNWRNKVNLIADDSDGDQFRHFLDAELLSAEVETNHPQFNIHKLYLDAYQQEITPNGEVAPDFYDLIKKSIEKGTLIVNYTGHGDNSRLAEETIIDIDLVKGLNNYDNLPLFVTATCEFGRYDDPRTRSGAEELLLNPKGGAIALLTTSRPVFADSNLELNLAFYNTVFSKVNDQYLRLGDIMIITKNNSLEGYKNRNFSLLGDPSMRLNYPKNQIVINSINGVPVESEIDTLSALQKVTMEGSITDSEFNKLTDYEGVLEAIIYDKKTTKQTLESEGLIYNFGVQDNIIFKGKVSINGGGFKLEFVVPKNISYVSDNGKISLYAKSKEGLLDANGANQDVIIGGSSKNIDTPDNNPPTVKLYMEDTSFVSGNYVNNNTLLLAHLTDESGINITNSGLGQNISAILDNTQVFNLNEFYETDLDSYQSGWVAFPINNLTTGKHTITMKAWDTFNNFTETNINFIVAGENEIIFEKLYNFPNPFDETTTFYLEHNRAGDDLALEIEIYSIKGELVKSMKYIYPNSPRTIDGIQWDGRGYAGKKMDDGLYIYRIILTSITDGGKNQQYEKLVIIN